MKNPKSKIFDFRMHDGSRNFGDLPEIVFFDKMREHLARFNGADETDFVTDWVTEMWLNFDYQGHKFSINNQNGDYWFFVEDPQCPEAILNEVLDHFEPINPIVKRITFYGGTFDPVHCGHLTVAKRLVELFGLDEFYFIPAFHAPHKADTKPTSGYHRFAMLCLATANEEKIGVSTIELDRAEKRYSIDTLADLKEEYRSHQMFFVMGADSWTDIRTWRDWEKVLLLTNHIVVSRPGYEIRFDHVTDNVRERIVDLRGKNSVPTMDNSQHIYVTDAVQFDVSATEIRDDVREDDILDRTDDVPPEVAKYIEKYELYR